MERDARRAIAYDPNMGFSFRKRVNLGSAARINVSKSGIGGSVGAKTGRVGITSQGKSYARGGAKGVYFRQQNNSTTSNKFSAEKSSSPEASTGKPAAKTFVNYRDYDIESLWSIYDQVIKGFLPAFEGIVIRGNQKQTIESCNKEYLRAYVNEKLGYDRRIQSEDAWKSFSETLKMFEPLMRGCHAINQTVQNFIVIRSKGISEVKYRKDLESTVESVPEYGEGIQAWCIRYDREWTRLNSLGWLPSLRTH